MSQIPQTAQEWLDWIKRNWLLILIFLVVIFILSRAFTKRRRIIIE